MRRKTIITLAFEGVKRFYGEGRERQRFNAVRLNKLESGNTKGGSITVLLTSCFTGLD
jgi:hypothetical protein